MRRRFGLLFAVLILSACDHHKPADQAQSGSAPVAQPDSDLTGQPAANPPYPKATLVALPATSTDNTAPDTNSVASAPPSSETLPAATPPAGSTSADSTPAASTAAASSTPDASSAAPASTPPVDSTATATTAAPTDSAMASTTAPAETPPVVTSTLPAPDNAAAQQQVVVLETSLGRIVIELDADSAPHTCENFTKLVSSGFYDHTAFHRVIPNFIIQGGDPNSKSDDRTTYGKGDPGYTLPAEIGLKHHLGSVAMARLPDSVNPKRDSNGSQFYICAAPCPSLDDNYTVFGHVIKGFDVIDKIANQPRDPRDNPLSRIEMSATLEPKDKALADDPVAQ